MTRKYLTLLFITLRPLWTSASADDAGTGGQVWTLVESGGPPALNPPAPSPGADAAQFDTQFQNRTEVFPFSRDVPQYADSNARCGVADGVIRMHYLVKLNGDTVNDYTFTIRFLARPKQHHSNWGRSDGGPS